MSTSEKIWETLKRIVNSPVYFYKSYKLYRKDDDRSTALKKAWDRTFSLLSKIPEIWKS